MNKKLLEDKEYTLNLPQDFKNLLASEAKKDLAQLEIKSILKKIDKILIDREKETNINLKQLEVSDYLKDVKNFFTKKAININKIKNHLINFFCLIKRYEYCSEQNDFFRNKMNIIENERNTKLYILEDIKKELEIYKNSPLHKNFGRFKYYLTVSYEKKFDKEIKENLPKIEELISSIKAKRAEIGYIKESKNILMNLKNNELSLLEIKELLIKLKVKYQDKIDNDKKCFNTLENYYNTFAEYVSNNSKDIEDLYENDKGDKESLKMLKYENKLLKKKFDTLKERGERLEIKKKDAKEQLEKNKKFREVESKSNIDDYYKYYDNKLLKNKKMADVLLDVFMLVLLLFISVRLTFTLLNKE